MFLLLLRLFLRVGKLIMWLIFRLGKVFIGSLVLVYGYKGVVGRDVCERVGFFYELYGLFCL